MASELITLDVYNQNGFGVIGTQLEGEFSIGNIIASREEKRRKAEEKAEEDRKKKAFANIKFKSVPTSSERRLLSGDTYQSEKKVDIVKPRSAINASYKLNDFQYSSAFDSSDYSAAGTTLSNLVISTSGTSDILSGINITVKGTNITALTDLVDTDKVYVNTTTYQRTTANKATLLPMDLLTLSNAKADIGLLVAEVYTKQANGNFKLEDNCEITLGNEHVLGGNYNKDYPKEIVGSGEKMSTARDNNGNVYVIKEDVDFGKIADFLTDNMIEPTNVSKADGKNPNRDPNFQSVNDIVLEKPTESGMYVSKKHTTNLPEPPSGTGVLCGFECYVKGFLIFNTNTASVDDSFHANMVWLEVPTLVSVTKTTDAETYTVKIGEIIASETTAAANGSLKISTVKFNDVVAYLPTESDFYEKNFETKMEMTNTTLYIQSLSKYYPTEG